MARSKLVKLARGVAIWVPTVLFGALFVMQGIFKLMPASPWPEMFRQWGYPAHFYLLVGMHGLHAIAAIFFLGRAWIRLKQGWLQPSQLATIAVFWYFVVLMWPVVYWRVYAV